MQAVAAKSVAGVVHTAVSDSMGRFTFSRVPVGRYTLGFFHPMLDSLGVEAPLREIYIDGTAPVRADLAIPSAERLRMVICRPKSGADLGAVILGAVRDSRDGMPVAGCDFDQMTRVAQAGDVARHDIFQPRRRCSIFEWRAH